MSNKNAPFTLCLPINGVVFFLQSDNASRYQLSDAFNALLGIIGIRGG
jgi:hypothetical protein